MRETVKNHLLITLGWLFVVLALIGAVLPLLPTTPLLIVALALFSKSSPRFHQMLLNNRWFGPDLRQWEESKSIARKSKRKATIAIVIMFSISIAVLHGRLALQLMLVCLCIAILLVLWRMREQP